MPVSYWTGRAQLPAYNLLTRTSSFRLPHRRSDQPLPNLGRSHCNNPALHSARDIRWGVVVYGKGLRNESTTKPEGTP